MIYTHVLNKGGIGVHSPLDLSEINPRILPSMNRVNLQT
jgi:hypothetical protein